MKKYTFGLFLLALLLLSGCQTSEGPADDASTSESSSQLPEDDLETESEESEAISDTADSDAEEQDEPVTYMYRVNGATSVIEPIEADDDTKVALLTIDDAPDGHAVEMAEALKEIEAPAIFFVNGMYLESEEGKEQLKQVYDLGFEIGNHTQTHPDLSTISPEDQREEILRTNELVLEVTGEKPRFFRAPHGITTDTSDQVMEEEGMVSMTWTYGYDWEPDYQDPAALTDIMLNTIYLSDGANLLMHDRSWTLEALVPIAEGLREQGYTLVDPHMIESPESEETEND